MRSMLSKRKANQNDTMYGRTNWLFDQTPMYAGNKKLTMSDLTQKPLAGSFPQEDRANLPSALQTRTSVFSFYRGAGRTTAHP